MEEDFKKELQHVLERLQSEVSEKEANSKIELENKLKVNTKESIAYS